MAIKLAEKNLLYPEKKLDVANYSITEGITETFIIVRFGNTRVEKITWIIVEQLCHVTSDIH